MGQTATNKPHPLALAIAAKTGAQPQFSDSGDINSAMKDAVSKISDIAQAKLGVEMLRSVASGPPAPDPLDQMTKLGGILGLRNAEEDREEKRLARERQDRLDQERLDEQRRLSAQSQSLEMMKFMMQMSQSQAETTQKLILQMSQDNQKLIERMETNTREMFSRVKENTKESDLERLFKEKTMHSILNPPQAPDPIEELMEQKQRLSVLGLVGHPTNGADPQLDFQIKREEIELRREEMQQKIEIERLKAENQGKQIAGGFEMIMGLLANRSANGQAAPVETPQGPPKTIPMAQYVCDKCENEWIDAYGIQNIICPRCKEHLEVHYPA